MKQLNSGAKQLSEEKNETKLFECHECGFKTKWKATLEKHVLVHKDFDQVELFKCKECPYVTKNNQSLRTHAKVHLNNNEVQMYKCNECSFETKYKQYLKKHLVIHKNFDEVETYQCLECSYISKNKNSLKLHSKLHKNNDELNTYTCNECHYVTKYKYQLKDHLIARHRRSEIIRKFKCSFCTYETHRNSDLKRHILIHKDVGDILGTYNCKHCSFVTESKCALFQHSRVHKKKKILARVKCPECNCMRININTHLLTHKGINEIEAYRCNRCPFVTKHKRSIIRHMQVHQKPQEANTFSTQFSLPLLTHNKQDHHKLNEQKNLSTHHQKSSKEGTQQLYDLGETNRSQMNESVTNAEESSKGHADEAHKQFNSRNTFECSEYSFSTKYKASLRRHVNEIHHQRERVSGNIKEEVDYSISDFVGEIFA